MINWTDIRAEARHNFTFKGLTDVHVVLKRNGSFLSFVDSDQIRHVYTLRGYPTLATIGIEVVFDISQFTLSGKEIPLQKGLGITEYVYTEPEELVDLFAGYSPPQGVGAFGLQQAINGLARRLEVFEGHPILQTGHMIYTFTGEAVQPVTFDVLNVQQESQTDNGDGSYTANADGSFEIQPVDGTGPFEYHLGDDNWQPIPVDEIVFTDLQAGPYTVAVRDSLGIWHSKTVEVPLEQIEIL